MTNLLDVTGVANPEPVVQSNFEALDVQAWTPTYGDGVTINLGAGSGVKIGGSTSQKLGFFNAAPVAQPAGVVDATGGATVDTEARAAINALIARLESLGLIAAV